MASAAMKVCKASATSFRDKFKDYVRKTKGRAVVLVENRRFESKYLVDKDWLDDFVKENESIKATFEILADRELTSRLLKLAESLDADVGSGKARLHSMSDAFGK
jgi:hypothetical protein